MSSRLTYGRNGRRVSSKLQPSVEFSPQKNNDLPDATITSSDTPGSENAQVTSPINSPIMKGVSTSSTPKGSDDQDVFDFGVFDLKEDDVVLPKPKRVNRTKSRNPIPKAKLETEPPRSPGASLSSFFIESSAKPLWSPSRSISSNKQTSSPKQSTPISSFSKSYNQLQSLSNKSFPKSPKKPVKISQAEAIGDVWDLLDISEQEKSQKKTMVFKESFSDQYQSPLAEELSISQENELMCFFTSEQTESKSDNSTSPPPPESQSQPGATESTSSPRKSRNMRTYGLQRTFLLEKEDQREHKNNDGSEEENITLISEADTSTTEGLKTISNLRAQGENAQLLDELNFIMEGIESSSTTVSLLELALKLFEKSFSNLLRNHGLPPMPKWIDLKNKLQVYITGFIACNVTENGKLEFDDEWVQVVVNLLANEADIDATKESKAAKAMFKEFQAKLDNQYSSRFFGLTLLIHNHLYINKEIFDCLVKVLTSLSLKGSPDIKLINMILLLFESFLSTSTEVHPAFQEIISIITSLETRDMNCNIAILKVLIVLSVKKFRFVFTKKLVDKSIEESIRWSNTSLGLLYLGLLINLVENAHCCQSAFSEINLARLYRLRIKLKDESRDYYSLLVGILITKEPMKMEAYFKRDELKQIVLQLQNFNSKGNSLITLQVEDILSQLHELKII